MAVYEDILFGVGKELLQKKIQVLAKQPLSFLIFPRLHEFEI